LSTTTILREGGGVGGRRDDRAGQRRANLGSVGGVIVAAIAIRRGGREEGRGVLHALVLGVLLREQDGDVRGDEARAARDQHILGLVGILRNRHRRVRNERARGSGGPARTFERINGKAKTTRSKSMVRDGRLEPTAFLCL